MRNHSILLLAMVVLWIGSAVNAKYSGGTGEPNDPYRIATPEDLNNIGNHQEDFNKHFILVNDVNLAQYTGTQFNIIGHSTTGFTGVFDGNDHKIWNFTWDSNGVDYVGLFGYVGSGGQIKNLGLENIDVNTIKGNPVGELVGVNDGMITNCYSAGSVIGYGRVGGLVGVNTYHGVITNSYSTGSASGSGVVTNGTTDVGGLVGVNAGMITNCYSAGSVTGYFVTGGLVGDNHGGTVTASFWDIETSDCLLNRSW